MDQLQEDSTKALTFDFVRHHPWVRAYIERADQSLQAIGYTEHGFRHASLVAHHARQLLEELGQPTRECELAAIAGYLHDIGNLVTRNVHAQSGAVLAHHLLWQMQADPFEAASIMAAIGNHHEADGAPVSSISAAVILADKTDVHRTRVRHQDPSIFDIHDRVNYAVLKSELIVQRADRIIQSRLEIDSAIASPMEYFEIFMERMVFCRKAAAFLGCRFQMTINDFSVI